MCSLFMASVTNANTCSMRARIDDLLRLISCRTVVSGRLGSCRPRGCCRAGCNGLQEYDRTSLNAMSSSSPRRVQPGEHLREEMPRTFASLVHIDKRFIAPRTAVELVSTPIRNFCRSVHAPDACERRREHPLMGISDGMGDRDRRTLRCTRAPIFSRMV
jgi:hypothetical protein